MRQQKIQHIITMEQKNTKNYNERTKMKNRTLSGVLILCKTEYVTFFFFLGEGHRFETL